MCVKFKSSFYLYIFFKHVSLFLKACFEQNETDEAARLYADFPYFEWTKRSLIKRLIAIADQKAYENMETELGV